MLPSAALAFNAGATPNANPSLTLGTLIDIVFNVFWIGAVAFFIVMFILAAFQFFTAQGEPEAVGQARYFVLWGVVGVAVALLAFSIPFVVRNTIGNGI